MRYRHAVAEASRAVTGLPFFRKGVFLRLGFDNTTTRQDKKARLGSKRALCSCRRATASAVRADGDGAKSRPRKPRKPRDERRRWRLLRAAAADGPGGAKKTPVTVRVPLEAKQGAAGDKLSAPTRKTVGDARPAGTSRGPDGESGRGLSSRRARRCIVRVALRYRLHQRGSRCEARSPSQSILAKLCCLAAPMPGGHLGPRARTSDGEGARESRADLAATAKAEKAAADKAAADKFGRSSPAGSRRARRG